jgi:hypothetical protein
MHYVLTGDFWKVITVYIISVNFSKFGFRFILVILYYLSTEHVLNASERLGRAVNTPASYSGDPGFKYRPDDRLSWIRGCDFSQSLQENTGTVP